MQTNNADGKSTITVPIIDYIYIGADLRCLIRKCVKNIKVKRNRMNVIIKILSPSWRVEGGTHPSTEACTKLAVTE